MDKVAHTVLLAAFQDELEKLAGSRLRRAVRVVHQRGVDSHLGSPVDRISLVLNGNEVGYLRVEQHGQHIIKSFIRPSYRGLGLGKKLYGEAMRLSGKPLRSDLSRSDEAERLWDSFARRGLATKVHGATKFPARRLSVEAPVTPGGRPVRVTYLTPRKALPDGYWEGRLPPGATAGKSRASD